MPIPPFPPVPDGSTYADGPLLVSELRSDVTDGVTFLSNRPVFSAYNTSTPSIPLSAFTNITLDTEVVDTWQGHSPLGSHPERYYCQSPGWYVAEGYVPWTYTGSTQFAFGVAFGVSLSGTVTTYQGQLHLTASGQNPGVFGADLVELLKTGNPDSPGSADYVELQAFTTSASGILLQGTPPNVPTLSLRWAGSGSASSLAVPGNNSFPVPPSFVTTSWLNTNIRDTVNFLTNPPMVRATYVPGSQNLASASFPTATQVTLNTEILDNFSAFSSSTFTVPAGCGGIYYIVGQVHLTSAATGTNYAAGITVNATTTWGGAEHANTAGGANQISTATGRFRLAAGDTVELAGFQNSGGSLAVGNQTKLVICWESS